MIALIVGVRALIVVMTLWGASDSESQMFYVTAPEAAGTGLTSDVSPAIPQMTLPALCDSLRKGNSWDYIHQEIKVKILSSTLSYRLCTLSSFSKSRLT